MVEHVTENHGVGSSILPLGTKRAIRYSRFAICFLAKSERRSANSKSGQLAQLVEHLVYTERVIGSSPILPTRIKLSGILPIDSAARSAAENGNTGSPRTARLAKRRFEIPCDFKYLLCPIKN